MHCKCREFDATNGALEGGLKEMAAPTQYRSAYPPMVEVQGKVVGVEVDDEDCPPRFYVMIEVGNVNDVQRLGADLGKLGTWIFLREG